jgi:hypothetical protein
VVSASSRQLSDSGIKQLVLAYKAKGSNGVVAEDWSPKAGFVYAQVRAISARVNQNFDAWPSAELKKSYRTFVGKPIFVNHQNFDVSKARGKVVAARYVEAKDDRFIETIMEVDAQRFPKLAREIREGGMDSVSMGVEAGLTICSACNNKAVDESEFCDHVRNHKGHTVKVRNARTGKLEDKLVYEDCYKLAFFELSWVFEPADESALTSRVMIAARREDEDGSLLDVLDEGQSMGGKDDTDYSQYVTQAPAAGSSAGSNSGGSNSSSDSSAPSSGGSGGSSGDSSYVPSDGVEQWRDEVGLALQHNELPSSLTDQVLHQIQTESSGNPTAINNWDSNAAAGTPSKGLLQTIDPTYQTYKLPGAGNDPYNPQDNLDAAINYAQDRYGPSLVNDSGNGLGSGHGYDQGGFLPPGKSVVHNDTGAPELIIPLKGKYSPFDSEFEDEDAVTKESSLRYAYGETEIPEDVDTLRDDENDSLDDYQFVEPVDLNTEQENPFQHWLESPDELSGPDFDMTNRFDQQQEAEGLDNDRLVENFGEVEGDPDFEDAPPRRKTMGRTRTAMPSTETSPVVEGPSVPTQQSVEDAFSGGSAGSGSVPTQQSVEDAFSGKAGRRHRAADEDKFLEDIEEVVDEDLDEDDDGQDDDEESDDDTAVDADGDGDVDAVVDHEGDDGDDGPPWLQDRQAKRRSARNRRRTRNKGQSPKGSAMSRRIADTSGHTDGGPYGRNDQGDCEEVYLSETPDGEAVAAPDGDSKITNTENNLVARIKAKSADLQRDIRVYQQMTAAPKKPYRATVAMIAALPTGQRKAAAAQMASAFKAENPRFSPAKFYAAINQKLADAVETPDTVDPALSGTDEQGVKGDDFDSVALDDVETQPKDASKKYFAAFDQWLKAATGRTAAQHNPEWLRRQAARWAQHKGINVAVLYPALGNVLRQARKGGNTTRKATPMNRSANESLEVAAPDARIDVEAPVKNDTDADAQASQYDLSDYAHNAGDQLADPELSSDSQIFAPGEKSAHKMASGVAAVRYAEAAINAGLIPATERFKLAHQAETMREAVVVDRTQLMEAIVAANASNVRQVPASVARSIPRGLASPARVASTRRIANDDPSNDSAIFF